MYHIYSPAPTPTVTYSGVRTPIGVVPCIRHIADWVDVAVADHIVVDWVAAAAVADMGYGRGSSSWRYVHGLAVGHCGSVREFYARPYCFRPSNRLLLPSNYG